MDALKDPLTLLDVIYGFEMDERFWLRALIDVIRPALGVSTGAAACTYDTSLGQPSISSFVTAGSFRASEIARALVRTSAASRAEVSTIGDADLFVLNGVEQSGHGVWIAVILAPNSPIPSDAWSSVAKQLARAIGLRRQLSAAARRTSQALTGREREVLAFAAAGNTTKLIAFELGIADATVRVLLKRAAKKLGARNRRDAIARFNM